MNCTKCGKTDVIFYKQGQNKLCQICRGPVESKLSSYSFTDGNILTRPIFDAYYDPTVDKYLTSYKEQEKVGRNFKTPQHPEGLSLVEDNRKFRDEMKYIRKHRLDYIREQYAKEKGRVTPPNGFKLTGTHYSYAK